MQKKIIVIDDETEILLVVQSRLKANGYDVVTCENGVEGLQKIQEDHPNLILLDITMPGMDGFQVLSQLKKDPETSKIPVIMLTARGESRSILKAQDLKASDYLIKPFASDELLAVIKRYI